MKTWIRPIAATLALAVGPGAGATDTAAPVTALVTGANRGIGLEFVRQLAARDWRVIATARQPQEATELQELAARHPRVTIEALDITDHAAVEALAGRYRDQPIDLLVLNAGLTPSYPSAFKPLAGVDFDIARRSFEVNALGTLKMCQAFMDLVAASGRRQIVVLSSKAGSFAESPRIPMFYEYRASKAALDMFMYTLSFETPKRGVTLTLLSPGQVNTVRDPKLAAMKRPGTIEAPESVAKMLTVIDSLTPADNGKFLSYEDRREIAW